ncbi:MAG: DNA gyrase subunit A, partial [Rhodospirillales bacterium]
ERKLPFLDDIRDESEAQMRLVLQPKSRTVEPEMLMEQLFRLTDLENRFSLNLNVLGADNVPRVMSLRDALRAFLDHRHEVLVRRSKFRLGKIEHRLEILDGFLIAFLNLDKVIKIIRTEDEPKPKLMKAFKLSDVQAEAILNMRLRQLRRLEETEIKKEHAALSDERKEIRALLRDETKRWKKIGSEITEIKKLFSDKSGLGKRRTVIGEPPSAVIVPLEAMIEREPITVVCSHLGWIRAAKGHITDADKLKYKEGDKPRFAIHAQTTDKLLVFATNGRFYTLGCDKLPTGRGHGEPLRLMIDLGNGHDVVNLLVHEPGRRLLVASDKGRGFIVPENEVIAQTKNGKQVLNLASDEEAAACSVVGPEDNYVAALGDNRKLLIFRMDNLPEMNRGRGVILQRYNQGGLADAKTYNAKEGLTWRFGKDRSHTETDLKRWIGKRAQAGLIVPKGFPKTGKFG